jgi:hypothetical protein
MTQLLEKSSDLRETKDSFVSKTLPLVTDLIHFNPVHNFITSFFKSSSRVYGSVANNNGVLDRMIGCINTFYNLS